jgi:hypothetical protein
VTDPTAGTSAVSVGTRRFVHAFLAVFVVCGIATFELLPFSGFRLFAEPRGAERRSWQLRAVDSDGDEHPIVLAELPLSYRNTSLLLEGWGGLSEAERDDVCDAWSGPRRASGAAVAEVRIYRLVGSVRPDAPPPERRLAYTCGRKHR